MSFSFINVFSKFAVLLSKQTITAYAANLPVIVTFIKLLKE